MYRLNAGAGTAPLEGRVNTDIAPGKGIDVLCDACHMPFKNGSFESVYARDLLHHVNDPPRAVRELERVTKKRLEVWESNRYSPYMLLFMVKSGFEHSHFSMRRFRRLFRNSRARFLRRSDYAHFTSKPPFGPVVEMLRLLSHLIPVYNVAVIDRNRSEHPGDTLSSPSVRFEAL